MENSLQQIPERIDKLFTEKLLSVADVAHALNVDRSTVYNYRNGKYPVSVQFLAYAASHIRRLSLRWLLLGEGEMLSVDVQRLENDPLAAIELALRELKSRS